MDCFAVLIYLVSILLVIVMLLIGWQIFNSFSFGCRMKKAFAKKLSVVERKFISRIKSLDDYTAGTISMMKATDFMKENKYANAIEGSAWVINLFVFSGNLQRVKKPGTC